MAVNIQLKDFDVKTAPVPADIVYLGNSADSFNEVQSTIAQLIAAYPALSSIAGLTTAANQYIYTTGIDTYDVKTITSTPTASQLSEWDANKNLRANNFLPAFVTTATAAGTTTLTVASAEIQEFTGSTTQTVVLPVTSTLIAGQGYTIINNSSGALTVNSSGGNLIQTMSAGTSLNLICVLTSGTTAASWQSDYSIDVFPLTIPNGGTGVTSVTTAPTASAFAGWDANSNLSANAFIEGFATTATAAGTTTLTVASKQIQEFTGATTQTVVMPVTSTLVAGMYFDIINNSSGALTINSSGGNLILTMAANTMATVVCVANSGTTAASWNASYVFDNGAGVLSITGTANQVIASASTGAIILSLPQSIDTAAAVQFGSLSLGAYAVLPITAWVAYTPTFTGFGTVSAVSIWSRRNGNNLEIRGTFTSGTATGVEAQITLGYNGTNANVSSSNTVLAAQNLVGTMVLSVVTGSFPVILVKNNVGYVNYGVQNAATAGSVAQNGNVTFVAGTVAYFNASIPIATWP